jgi:hypothetical protein
VPYGSALGVTAPTVSVTAGPTYATQVNAFLAALQTVVEAKVTPSGMDMNADLSMLSSGTYSRLKDALGVSFNNGSLLSATTYPTTLYFSGGELYANDASSNQVKITNGGAVNVSASGGITGSGYGSSSVEVNWDSGNVAYRMRSGSGANSFADVVCDDVLLNDGSGNYLTIAAPAMAADYTATLPNAVPASNNTLLTMATTGAITNTGTPTLTSITTTGAGSIGTTLGVTGLITATAGLTAAANQHVTVSGTGRFKHGAMELVIPGCAFHPLDEAINFDYSEAGSITNSSADGTIFVCPLHFPVGTRVTSAVWTVYHDILDANTRTYKIRYRLLSGGDGDVDSDTSTTTGDTTVTNATGFTAATGTQYLLHWTARASDAIVGVVISYDFP